MGGYNTADTVARDRIQDEVGLGHEITYDRIALVEGRLHVNTLTINKQLMNWLVYFK